MSEECRNSEPVRQSPHHGSLRKCRDDGEEGVSPFKAFETINMAAMAIGMDVAITIILLRARLWSASYSFPCVAIGSITIPFSFYFDALALRII